MPWYVYCRWYLHYLREPYGSMVDHFYQSQNLWAALASLLGKKAPSLDDCTYRLIQKKPVEIKPESASEIKAKMRGW